MSKGIFIHTEEMEERERKRSAISIDPFEEEFDKPNIKNNRTYQPKIRELNNDRTNKQK